MMPNTRVKPAASRNSIRPNCKPLSRFSIANARSMPLSHSADFKARQQNQSADAALKPGTRCNAAVRAEHREAAIHRNIDASNPRRGVGSQKGDRIANLAAIAHAPQRMEWRSDGIGGGTPTLGQGLDGGRMEGAASGAELAAGAAEIDDDAAAPHVHDGLLGENCRRHQIHIQTLKPFG